MGLGLRAPLDAPAFCEWEYIHLFWKNMIDWVVQR